MSSVMSTTVGDFGSWKSRITSETLTKGNCKQICELQARNGHVFWTEQTFPAGVRVLFERNAANQIVRWSPQDVNINNTVHEYGGGSFYVGDQDERVFIVIKGGIHELPAPMAAPRPIFQGPPGSDIRHADLYAHGDYVYAVQERHEKGGEEPANLLVRVHIESGECSVVAEGADFYAEPRVSVDGKYLAWIEWNKPFMPWDQTSVQLAQIPESGSDFKSCAPCTLLRGFSYYGLQWSKAQEDKLYVVGDESGYWNVYTVNIGNGGLKQNIYPINKEIGGPLWQFADDRPFAVGQKDIVLALEEELLHHSDKGDFQAIKAVNDAGFTVFAFLTISGNKLFSIASGPRRSTSVIQVDLKTLAVEIIRETRASEELAQFDISTGQSIVFDSDGVNVEGYFYPPSNSEYSAPPNTLPPVILLAHEGPTMRTTNGLNLKKQYYTSRGFAIFDVNYRGSTGYGTEFRNLLLGNWGVVDTADMINGAKHLIDHGLVDPKKVCIYGGSAGGFLVLSTLFHPKNPFAAAVSVYGVSDLVDIFNASHKFESDYTVRLVAPYPEGKAIYKERSAVCNLEKINTPVAFLHGTEDPVVPCGQSVLCFEKLKERGIKTTLKLFPGESHGFKTTEAVTQTVDISYIFFCRILGIKPSVDVQVEIQNE